MCKNSQTFIKNIKSSKIKPDEQLVSFDAEALYPSIPLNKCIEIIKQKIQKKIIKITKLNMDDICELINFGLTSNFKHNNQQYDMEGSGPIGLSLIVIIAKIYMDYTIEEALKLAKKEKIKRPRALHVYMDDTFGIIKQNEEKIEHLNFLKCLNKVHLALKFTCEIEKNNRISFLDT